MPEVPESIHDTHEDSAIRRGDPLWLQIFQATITRGGIAAVILLYLIYLFGHDGVPIFRQYVEGQNAATAKIADAVNKMDEAITVQNKAVMEQDKFHVELSTIINGLAKERRDTTAELKAAVLSNGEVLKQVAANDEKRLTLIDRMTRLLDRNERLPAMTAPESP